MKKLKISRASSKTFLIVVLILFSITRIITIEQITNASLVGMSKVEDVVRIDITTKSSS